MAVRRARGRRYRPLELATVTPELTEDECRHLDGLVRQAEIAEGRGVEAAIEELLGSLPRPVRILIRRSVLSR